MNKLIKMLTLNIRQGGGKRINDILTYLVSQNAEIIVLTELRSNNNGDLLKSNLIDNGYEYCFTASKIKNKNSV